MAPPFYLMIVVNKKDFYQIAVLQLLLIRLQNSDTLSLFYINITFFHLLQSENIVSLESNSPL